MLARTWESVKAGHGPGALDPLVKEMIYLAVSVTNGCAYCIASHTAGARKAGMSEAMFGELMAVVGMANETNRLANGYRVPIDAAFDKLIADGVNRLGRSWQRPMVTSCVCSRTTSSRRGDRSRSLAIR